jgi:hypothetical protein
MSLIQWKQIDPQLRSDGQLSGSLYLSGSFFLNNVDILNQVQESGIFRQTGSYWATTNDIQITGSFKINLPTNETFSISTEGEQKFSLNEEGVLVLTPFENTPTPVPGGLIYSGSNEFLVGL